MLLLSSPNCIFDKTEVNLAGAYLVLRFEYVVRFAIWYHLYNFKNVKNTNGGVLILVKLQAEAFTKINTPP